MFLIAAALLLLVLQSSSCKATQNYFEDTIWVKKVPNFGSFDDVRFSKNDSLIVAHGYGTNIFFETKNGNEIKRIISYAPIQFFNNDENFVQISPSNDRLEIYQTSNFKAIDTLEYKTDSIISILVSKDEKYVIGVLKDGFCAWDLKTHKILKTINFPEEEYLRSIECTVQNLCDNKTFLASFYKIYYNIYPPYEDILKISYNIYNYSDLDSINSIEGTGICRISNNCEILAKSTRDANYGVELINFKTGELIQKLPIDGKSITGIEFSPDDKYVLTSNGYVALMRIWDINKGIGIYDYKDGGYQNLDISKDGKLIITCIGEYLLLYPAKYGGTFVPEKGEVLKVIYPNPSNNIAIIEFVQIISGNTKLELINTNGEIIKTFLNTFLETGYQKIEINTSDIPSGNYYIVVKNEKEQFLFQLIVVH